MYYSMTGLNGRLRHDMNFPTLDETQRSQLIPRQFERVPPKVRPQIEYSWASWLFTDVIYSGEVKIH